MLVCRIICFQKKACELPYKWPLLADGQDPTTLEARLAFHLHRLRMTGRPLRDAIKAKAYLATALAQGRITIENGFIEELATALSIKPYELARPLLETESLEWSFYRSSAKNSRSVWHNAMAIARARNMSLRETANIMGMSHADLINALSGKRPRILERRQAEILAALSNPPSHPETLLPIHPNAAER